MNVYFGGQWLVRRVKKKGLGTGGALLAIADIAQDNDCFLVMDEWKNWHQREDGCYIIPFKWSAPSKEQSEKFLQHLADYIDFKEVKSITRQDFDSGDKEDFIATVLSSVEFALYIEEIAEKNEKILSV